jgi:DNA-binding winged helix-turn-helix (wHTH) protein
VLVLKDDLMKAVWPDSLVEESDLTQNIFSLRKTLRETVEGKPYIVTIPGRGYRFVEAVQLIGEEEESLVLASHSRSRAVIQEEEVKVTPLSAMRFSSASLAL